jgi:carbonic anhydrase/acetyltransferase-like protein (isoleucine patch superfamily)
MREIEKLLEHIITRVSINLRKPYFDVAPYIRKLVPVDSHALYYAFYALTPNHPLYFRFNHSSLAGTYFLGKCEVDHSILYKSDIRGDELKTKGSTLEFDGIKVTLYDDEIIRIKDSMLVKTLVHANSHNPESLEIFRIINTVALHYSNIHGTTMEGCLLMPFATVDLSMCHDCIFGEFSYVQAGDLSHEKIEKGRIWVRAEGAFEFNYRFPDGVVDKYISLTPGSKPKGELIDFCESRKEDFIPIYSSVIPELGVEVPESAFVSPYAVVKGNCKVGNNVLVSQRAYIESSSLGDGANAQESCYIVNSTYDGMNVTAHGGKVIHAHLGRKVFTGFNSFVRGKADAKITVGKECIIMPHTIIDAVEPITIPERNLVWGYITKQADLEANSLSLDEVAKIKGQFRLGNMSFDGLGSAFVKAFQNRIEHILEVNGAYCDCDDTKGHAQETQAISYNILQPYPEGALKGLCPTVTISPLVP